MIWWLWTAFQPVVVHVLNVHELWNATCDDGPCPDVAWLGECAWTARTDTMGLGLR